jgi:hypothetical protein
MFSRIKTSTEVLDRTNQVKMLAQMQVVEEAAEAKASRSRWLCRAAKAVMFPSSLWDTTLTSVPSALEAIIHSVVVDVAPSAVEPVVHSAVEAVVHLVVEDAGLKLIRRLKISRVVVGVVEVALRPQSRITLHLHT